MQRLYVVGTLTKCLLRKGMRLWEVKNAVFVSNCELDCMGVPLQEVST